MEKPRRVNSRFLIREKLLVGSVERPVTVSVGPLVSDIGHIILQVRNMEEALRLYRDTLGLEEVKERSSSPVWKVLKTRGGELTLFRVEKPVPLVLRDEEDTPLTVHVANFEVAADELERQGYRVKRQGKNRGILMDPWGNLLGMHDHREG